MLKNKNVLIIGGVKTQSGDQKKIINTCNHLNYPTYNSDNIERSSKYFWLSPAPYLGELVNLNVKVL